MAYKIGYPTCEPPIIWDNYITHMFLWEYPELDMACIYIYMIPSETVFAVYKYIYIYIFIYLVIYLYIYLSVYVSVCLSVYLIS